MGVYECGSLRSADGHQNPGCWGMNAISADSQTIILTDATAGGKASCRQKPPPVGQKCRGCEHLHCGRCRPPSARRTAVQRVRFVTQFVPIEQKRDAATAATATAATTTTAATAATAPAVSLWIDLHFVNCSDLAPVEASDTDGLVSDQRRRAWPGRIQSNSLTIASYAASERRPRGDRETGERRARDGRETD